MLCADFTYHFVAIQLCFVAQALVDEENFVIFEDLIM